MKKQMFSKIGLASSLLLLVSSNVVNAADCFGGAGYCLKSKNAEFQLDNFGVMEMTVNGLTHIYTTDFIIAEHNHDPLIVSPFPLAILDFMDPFQPATATSFTMSNLAISSWGSASLSVELIGGDIGTTAATLIETFTITNTSLNAVDLGMFAYTDVDLGGGAGAYDDFGQLLSFDNVGDPISYRQWDGTDELIATVDKAPDFYQVGLGNGCILDVCEAVYYGVDLILPNTVDPGPGDLQMAAQWHRILGAGESFSFTQQMDLNGGAVSAIPVPAAAWLFGSGLIGLVGFARKKQKA